MNTSISMGVLGAGIQIANLMSALSARVLRAFFTKKVFPKKKLMSACVNYRSVKSEYMVLKIPKSNVIKSAWEEVVFWSYQFRSEKSVLMTSAKHKLSGNHGESQMTAGGNLVLRMKK